MGSVHRAVQEPLGREVALEFLPRGIAGEQDGRPFYAMELVDGATPLVASRARRSTAVTRPASSTGT